MGIKFDGFHVKDFAVNRVKWSEKFLLEFSNVRTEHCGGGSGGGRG